MRAWEGKKHNFFQKGAPTRKRPPTKRLWFGKSRTFSSSKLGTHPTRPQKGVPKKRPNPPGHCKNGTQEPLLEGTGLDTPFRPQKTAKNEEKKVLKSMPKTSPKQQGSKGWKQQKTLRGLAKIKVFKGFRASTKQQKITKQRVQQRA